MTCQKCHTAIPHLNAFGQFFLANGYRIPGVEPGPAFPVAIKANFAYTSEPDPAGLPKAVVDEVEVFLAGLAGPRTNYFFEQYVVDGGNRGLTRDAWVNYRATPAAARVPVWLQAGSFTLPLPVDPETFRESAQHYTVFDQTIGNNPFNFFDPKIGLQVGVGSILQGTSLRVFAGPGHDRQSGLPTVGTDVMGYGQQVIGPFTLSLYRYEGARPDVADLLDRFSRQGYGFTYASGRWTSESVLQTGWDSSVNGLGFASSGGFTQLRYEIGPRLFALARYEGTNDTAGFARDGVLLLGMRVTHNARFTVEDIIQHVPQTKHTLNAQYTVGY
ncbi:hypothetical protein EPN44_08060 [bacterium]|nr:MAG: hypothetical protein EPN44_08060 [bacterium]